MNKLYIPVGFLYMFAEKKDAPGINMPETSLACSATGIPGTCPG